MASVGIATVCMNREENLIKSLPSWLESGAECIHILDWNSKINLEELIKQKFEDINKIKFYKINNGDKWVLTHSFNFVLSSLKTDFIAKFDCDHICKLGIFNELNLEKGSFYRFNFKDNKDGTNGAFISCREILERANFFDERIVTYGWDESDLFERVQDFSKTICFLDPSYISHLPHFKDQRTESQNICIERRLSEFLNIDKDEFSTKCNFFKVSLSKKWNTSFKSGFVNTNEISPEKDINKFYQKEFFNTNIISLALILTIQYFQINNVNCDLNYNSPVKFLNDQIANTLLDYLKDIPSEQWNIVEIIKYLQELNSTFIDKGELSKKLKDLFLNSSENNIIKKIGKNTWKSF